MLLFLRKTGIDTTANLVKIQVSLKAIKREQAESVKNFIRINTLALKHCLLILRKELKWFLVHLYQG